VKLEIRWVIRIDRCGRVRRIKSDRPSLRSRGVSRSWSCSRILRGRYGSSQSCYSSFKVGQSLTLTLTFSCRDGGSDQSGSFFHTNILLPYFLIIAVILVGMLRWWAGEDSFTRRTTAGSSPCYRSSLFIMACMQGRRAAHPRRWGSQAWWWFTIRCHVYQCRQVVEWSLGVTWEFGMKNR
jgi:hypothetical protein